MTHDYPPAYLDVSNKNFRICAMAYNQGSTVRREAIRAPSFL